MILNMIKEPIIGLFLVFFYRVPYIQIGGAFFITALFFILEVVYKPRKKMAENVRNILSNGIYALTNLIFLLLYFFNDQMSEEMTELFIGWPLIVSVSLLILSNYYISMSAAYRNLRAKIKNYKHKHQNNRISDQKMKK